MRSAVYADVIMNVWRQERARAAIIPFFKFKNEINTLIIDDFLINRHLPFYCILPLRLSFGLFLLL